MLFILGFALGVFLISVFYYILLRPNMIKSNLLYKVIHINQKTTILEEQTIARKHILIYTSNFAGRPIRPGNIVSQAQHPAITRILKLDFLPLLKEGEENEILKSLGNNMD